MKYTLVLLLTTINFFSFAQKSENFVAIKNMKQVEQKLNAHSATLNTIYSDFTQEKHLAYLNDVIISEGKFWFKKENLLRWEYTSPYKYIIAINNGKFTIKDGDDIKAYDINSNKAFQEVNNMIVSSVKGDLLKENKFTVTALKSSDSYLIRLVPNNKEMAKILKTIELYFNISDLNIYKVKMIENEEDYTIILFKNKKINEAIPASIFILN